MTGRSRARDRSRPSGGAQAWTPWAQLGGQWFDGAGTTVGSPVSSWSASGSSAVAVQAMGANQPAAPAVNANLGGELALAFDGTDIVVSNTAVDLSAGWTLVSVVRLGTLRNWVGLARVSTGEATGAAGADGVVLYADVGGGLVIGSPDASTWYRLVSGGTLASGKSYALIATCSGTGASVALERGEISGGSISWSTATLGPTVGTFAMPAATGRYLQPGGGWSSAVARMVGDIAQQGAIGRVITALELSALKSYLQARFAL